MAIRTQQRKKQQLLISVLGLVVIVTVGVVFLGRGGAPEVPPPIPPTSGEQIIPRVTIPNELFIDRSFQGLVPYDPVTLPENIGKNNPFKP